MNKEEILQKARQEGNDEMEIQIRDKSIRYTYITMVVLAAVFSLIRSEQGLPVMDLCTTVAGSVCVGQLYRYVRSKDKCCLRLAVITLIVAVAAAVRFFMGH